MGTQSSAKVQLHEDLVAVKREQAITTSLRVAEVFGKRHDNVLQSIERLDCSESFRLLNFQESSYANEQSKKQPMYLVTKDGFTFLVMGFRGRKSAAFKEKYIAAFNRMEKIIAQRGNAEWIEQRKLGKVARRELSDVIAVFVEYATARGSKNARFYYANITNMAHKALGIVGQASDLPFRELLGSLQLSFLVVAEEVCRSALLDGMSQGLGYKEIYRLAKERVEDYAAILPGKRLLGVN
ncbi:MAG: Rha family transcriptional regulator [Desulfuromonas sp.]|nr:Rha family transcriptional regulator [Desulfuromonas sp.]